MKTYLESFMQATKKEAIHKTKVKSKKLVDLPEEEKQMFQL